MSAAPSVTELTNALKEHVETKFRRVAVTGEVSQPTFAASGHVYFTLKDAGAQLACVAWRSTVQRLNLTGLKHGQQLVLEGDIQIYAPRGNYQLVVSGVRQAGLGALQEAFERLKKQLEAEGLFDAARKRPLPNFPKRIGVVTSPTGAAFQDIRDTLDRRWPLATLVLFPAAVQGTAAVGEIVAGIQAAAAARLDVLIVGRGGGSLEDLWAFNEEAVARAIAACPVPVISAVGHETDFTISDFVADVRAATPTQAVVLATDDIADWRFTLDERARELRQLTLDHIRRRADRVSGLRDSHGLLALRDKIAHRIDRVKVLNSTIRVFMGNRIQQQSTRMQQVPERLHALLDRRLANQRETVIRLRGALDLHNPETPLRLGYARVMQNGTWVRAADTFDRSSTAELVWKSGRVTVRPEPE